MADADDRIDTEPGQERVPAYAYRASPLGSPWIFRLLPHALEWSAGYNRGTAPYAEIARMRLSFRPMTMQMYRFATEIWIPGRAKLTIASTSASGLIQHETHNADYRAFVHELARRIAAAGDKMAFRTGSPPLLYWPGVVIFGGVSIALILLMLRSLGDADWRGLAILAALFAFFLWQVGTFFYRNRPGEFDPLAPPERVLPSV
jgi:hypothetical protein